MKLLNLMKPFLAERQWATRVQEKNKVKKAYGRFVQSSGAVRRRQRKLLIINTE